MAIKDSIAENFPVVPTSVELANYFKQLKQGDMGINEFCILAVAKGIPRLQFLFMDMDIPVEYFEEIVSKLSLRILTVLHDKTHITTIKNPSAYFVTTAENLVTDLLRKLPVMAETNHNLDELVMSDNWVQKLDSMDAIQMATKNEFDSKLVCLLATGYTQREAAIILRKSISTINVRLNKIRIRYERIIKKD